VGTKRARQVKAVATITRMKIRKAINGHEVEFLSGLNVLSASVLKWQDGSLGNSGVQFITIASVCQIAI
jgi:hypothetical protein